MIGKGRRKKPRLSGSGDPPRIAYPLKNTKPVLTVPYLLRANAVRRLSIFASWLTLGSSTIQKLSRNGVLGNANGIVLVFTAQHNARHLAFASILLDHASRILVLPQADKLRMSQPISFGPF